MFLKEYLILRVVKNLGGSGMRWKSVNSKQARRETTGGPGVRVWI
jgi:hypothetical protein